jgi:hypothetical protein
LQTLPTTHHEPLFRVASEESAMNIQGTSALRPSPVAVERSTAAVAISTQPTDAAAAANGSADAAGAAQNDIDQATNRPVPLRFPWLSRLTQQLEPASQQPMGFAAAPVIGDLLNRSA